MTGTDLMKHLLVLCSLILLNCAPPGDYEYHYKLGCADIESEFEMDQAGTTHKLAIAENLFDAKFGPGEFCRLSSSVHYYVKNVCHWDGLAGYTNYDDSVQLEKRMSAINHELIHVLEGQHLKLGTTHHEGWNDPVLRYDYSHDSNYEIGWQFARYISPFPESHDEGFDFDQLKSDIGTDGSDCWEEQRDK